MISKEEIVEYVNESCSEITAKYGYGFEDLECGQCSPHLILNLLEKLELIGIKHPVHTFINKEE